MMKKFLLFTMICAVCVACTETKTEAGTLNEEMCQMYALCIPDHEMLESSRKYFTTEYLQAWDNIIAMPDEAEYAGYESDAEWVYYFVSGNGDAEELKAHILSVQEQDSVAYITMYYTHNNTDNQSNSTKHIISLVRRNNQWLIDDYDDTKKKMQEWVESAVNNFPNKVKLNNFDVFEGDKTAISQYIQDMGEFISLRER